MASGKAKKVLITAGGSGGHLFPAQALAEDIHLHFSQNEILFVAGGLNQSRYFDQKRFQFHEIACSRLITRQFSKGVKGIWDLCKGFGQAKKILKSFNPDVVVGFGSYYTVATLLAAKWLKIPIILHEANSVPGHANRWLASLANVIAVNFACTASFFKKSCVEVGLPLRAGYRKDSINRQQALSYYGFSEHKPTMLIFGGSQGARKINELFMNSECYLPENLQILHFTGSDDLTMQLTKNYADKKMSAIVKTFENRMDLAWTSADLFLGRAGASTLAESIEFEVPGILIPYPFANQHQEKNADFFVNTIGGGIKILESNLCWNVLKPFFQGPDFSDSFQTFKNALKEYKSRPTLLSLTDLVCDLHHNIGTK